MFSGIYLHKHFNELFPKIAENSTNINKPHVKNIKIKYNVFKCIDIAFGVASLGILTAPGVIYHAIEKYKVSQFKPDEILDNPQKQKLQNQLTNILNNANPSVSIKDIKECKLVDGKIQVVYDGNLPDDQTAINNKITPAITQYIKQNIPFLKYKKFEVELISKQEKQKLQIDDYSNQIQALIDKQPQSINKPSIDEYQNIFNNIQDPEVMLGVMNKILKNTQNLYKENRKWLLATLLWEVNYYQYNTQISLETLLTLVNIHNLVQSSTLTLQTYFADTDGSLLDSIAYISTINGHISKQVKQLRPFNPTKQTLEELYNIYKICYNIALTYNDTDKLDTDNMSLYMAKKAESLLNDNQTTDYNKILEIINFCSSVAEENAQPIYQMEYKILQKIYTNGDNQFNSIDLQILANTVIVCNHENFLKFSDHFPIPQNHDDMIQAAAQTVIDKLQKENINNATIFDLQNYAYCLLQLKDTNEFQKNYKNQIQLIYKRLQNKQTSNHPCLKYCCKFLCAALGIDEQTIQNLDDENSKVPNYLELLQKKL